jgi:hypothetical protein
VQIESVAGQGFKYLRIDVKFMAVINGTTESELLDGTFDNDAMRGFEGKDIQSGLDVNGDIRNRSEFCVILTIDLHQGFQSLDTQKSNHSLIFL